VEKVNVSKLLVKAGSNLKSADASNVLCHSTLLFILPHAASLVIQVRALKHPGRRRGSVSMARDSLCYFKADL